MDGIYIGLDIGSSTVKVAELISGNNTLNISSCLSYEHFNNPKKELQIIFQQERTKPVLGVQITGPMSGMTKLPTIPIKYARMKGFNYLYKINNCVILSFGHKCNSILEIVENRLNRFEENSKCAQGSGSFLQSMFSRFNTSVDKINFENFDGEKRLNLPGRCPVLLKSSITHLHNNGESQKAILAALLDVISENLLVNYSPDQKIKCALLTGGVSKILRVRNNISSLLKIYNIDLIPEDEKDYFIDAIGCALTAFEKGPIEMNLNSNLLNNGFIHWEKTPALSEYLGKIKKLQPPQHDIIDKSNRFIAGLDIGSTGSKLVLIDYKTQNIIFEDYVKTNGEPLNAVKRLLYNLIPQTNIVTKIICFAVTGSGRFLIESILKNLFGHEQVYMFNEIIAHTNGALYYDQSVDTIFEIGGQDSKYIRISNGIITDFALNDACSAGTGSFLEELCNRFSDYFNLKNLNNTALAAEYGIILGQHCSVFISDVIEKAIFSGCTKESLAVGLFDSVIVNYLNRVKKNRTIGKKIFCQGMPFSMEALACSVARQTGCEIIIPNNPGTIGALGASLLARRSLINDKSKYLNIDLVFNVDYLAKDNFLCKSNIGCSKPGIRCVIEKVTIKQQEKIEELYWEGNCTLWDKQNKKTISSFGPNPFLQRKQLIDKIKNELNFISDAKTVAITDKFDLIELFPFFSTFFSNLGYNVITPENRSESFLSEGKRHSKVALCSPALMNIGEIHSLLEKKPDYLFKPIFVNSINYLNNKKTSNCPILQCNSYLIKNSLNGNLKSHFLTPLIRIGKENIYSKEFYDSCRSITDSMGINGIQMDYAFKKGIEVQKKFFSDCLDIGDSALKFCKNQNVIPVVVLGKIYSIHNKYLNSNVTDYLRELDVITIPMDCYRLNATTVDFSEIYWGYAQQVLIASDQISKQTDVFSVFCSNYSCGPDSFLESYYNYIMDKKPSLIIENDGDTGNIGTKTRLEIFLHCINEYKKTNHNKSEKDISVIFKKTSVRLSHLLNSEDRLLLPYIGHSSNAVAAVLRGSGIKCEALPQPTNEAFALGKRFTSGKECLPMSVTIGNLLHYIYTNRLLEQNIKIYYFMPGSDGPCRFGNYHILDKLILNNLGLQDKVSILSTSDDELFEGMPPSLNVIIYLALISIDNLVACSDFIRPIENKFGETNKLFNYYYSIIIDKLKNINCFSISDKKLIFEILGGNLFGFTKLFKNITQDYLRLKTSREVKTVSLDGALYVRLDPFTNQNIAQKLESLGLRIKHVPFTEWLDFLNSLNDNEFQKNKIKNLFNNYLRKRIRTIPNSIVYNNLGVPRFSELETKLNEISPYIGSESVGEAILSIGSSMALHKKSQIDGIINICPFECLQCKVADSIVKDSSTDIITKSIEFNEDPIDPALITDFVFDLEYHEKGK